MYYGPHMASEADGNTLIRRYGSVPTLIRSCLRSLINFLPMAGAGNADNTLNRYHRSDKIILHVQSIFCPNIGHKPEKILKINVQKNARLSVSTDPVLRQGRISSWYTGGPIDYFNTLFLIVILINAYARIGLPNCRCCRQRKTSVRHVICWLLSWTKCFRPSSKRIDQALSCNHCGAQYPLANAWLQ